MGWIKGSHTSEKSEPCCELPSPNMGEPGDIWECDDCKRQFQVYEQSHFFVGEIYPECIICRVWVQISGYPVPEFFLESKRY